MKKKLFPLTLFLLLLLTACGGGPNGAPNNGANAPEGENGAQEAALDTEKTYVVGLDDTFAPMGYRDEKGELIGFDVDLATDAAERMGITVEFQPIDWSMKETELEGGNIDFIWNGYSVTPERKEKVAFSEPYMKNRQIIVALAESPVESKADLAGKTVTVQAESSALEAVLKDEAFVESLATAPVEYGTNVEAFQDVESGRSDVIVVDEVLARYYMKEQGQEKYKILEDNFGEEEFAVGLRKDDTALLAALNEAMKAQVEDGTYDEIYTKYFAD
ncbi:MAG: amino acid ABC transporter substrate-binding protein [Tissierellia bacterium]|nr:amino acid ABC transporter substrate-binding protein [Tissierellia bacterium]